MPRAYAGAMEIELSPELQAKLERIASQQGRDTKSLVHEAVERLVGYDEWFLRQVETGLAQADRGELLEDRAVAARMENLITRKQHQVRQRILGNSCARRQIGSRSSRY
jgi:predicted transcriptional regulator